MNRMSPWLGRTLMAALGVVLAAGSIPASVTAQAPDPEAGSAVIYLVRHAERAADDPTDPTLTPAGEARARELARLLGDAPLERIFSTDYRRTRLTAAPVAEAHGLAVEEYDPRGEGLEAFAGVLRGTPGHHLVVGHSNTTPELVRALGGDPVSPIGEMEYDRIYLVVVAPDGTVASTLLRFGAPQEVGGGSPGSDGGASRRDQG